VFVVGPVARYLNNWIILPKVCEKYSLYILYVEVYPSGAQEV